MILIKVFFLFQWLIFGVEPNNLEQKGVFCFVLFSTPLLDFSVLNIFALFCASVFSLKAFKRHDRVLSESDVVILKKY